MNVHRRSIVAVEGSTTHRPPDGTAGALGLQHACVKAAAGRSPAAYMNSVKSAAGEKNTSAPGASPSPPPSSVGNNYQYAPVKVGSFSRWSTFFSTIVSESIQSTRRNCVSSKTRILLNAMPQNTWPGGGRHSVQQSGKREVGEYISHFQRSSICYQRRSEQLR